MGSSGGKKRNTTHNILEGPAAEVCPRCLGRLRRTCSRDFPCNQRWIRDVDLPFSTFLSIFLQKTYESSVFATNSPNRMRYLGWCPRGFSTTVTHFSLLVHTSTSVFDSFFDVSKPKIATNPLCPCIFSTIGRGPETSFLYSCLMFVHHFHTSDPINHSKYP